MGFGGKRALITVISRHGSARSRANAASRIRSENCSILPNNMSGGLITWIAAPHLSAQNSARHTVRCFSKQFLSSGSPDSSIPFSARSSTRRQSASAIVTLLPISREIRPLDEEMDDLRVRLTEARENREQAAACCNFESLLVGVPQPESKSDCGIAANRRPRWDNLGLQAVPPEKLDPSDGDRGTPDHHVERSYGLPFRVGSVKPDCCWPLRSVSSIGVSTSSRKTHELILLR
jgi:hypothetical protein